MTNVDILDKVRKLRAMAADNANVNEAALAAAKAQELIERHRLAEADLCAVDDVDIIQDVLEEEQGCSFRHWKISLAGALASANNCRLFVTKGKRGGGYRATVNAQLKLVGSPPNIAATRYLFQALSRDIERLCKEAIKRGEGAGKSWANSFRIGAVATLKQRLKEAKENARVGATSTAIIKVDNELNLVAAWMKENIDLKRGTQHSVALDHGGYCSGQQAGRRMNLYDSRKTPLGAPQKALRWRG